MNRDTLFKTDFYQLPRNLDTITFDKKHPSISQLFSISEHDIAPHPNGPNTLMETNQWLNYCLLKIGLENFYPWS